MKAASEAGLFNSRSLEPSLIRTSGGPTHIIAHHRRPYPAGTRMARRQPSSGPAAARRRPGSGSVGSRQAAQARADRVLRRDADGHHQHRRAVRAGHRPVVRAGRGSRRVPWLRAVRRRPPRPSSAGARPAAPMMLVGEQPGDVEDQRGEPFVGPAGKLLDKALAEAGVDPARSYLTNAVKHFAFTRARHPADPPDTQARARGGLPARGWPPSCGPSSRRCWSRSAPPPASRCSGRRSG